MLKMLIKWFLLLILVDVASLIENPTACLFEEKHFDGQYIKQIHLQKPSNVKYTWDWTKGTSNITIVHTNDIEITHNTTDDTLKLTFNTISDTGEINSGSQTTYSCFGSLALLALTAVTFLFEPNKNRYVVAVLFVFAILGFSTSSMVKSPCNELQINVKVPIEYAERICVNQEQCFPIKCSLSFVSKSSTFPANNKVLFTGKFCELRKPDRWDEWVMYYFKTNVSTERYYLLDNDNDGLVNFIEYYGGVNFFNRTNDALRRERRSLLSPDDIGNDGTDPTDPDTDDDLLNDGFEYSNGLSPKRADEKNADPDKDGLTNLKEQILGTDPLNADTDGDGVEDGIEVANKADPKDPRDRGQISLEQSFAMVNLTIGDHSGSHSERYIIRVGEFEHQSPDYGEIGSGVYKYLPGNYSITVHHESTIFVYIGPDYDYTARVEKVSGKAAIEVLDPKGILGKHDESVENYAFGKSATLIVKDIDKPGSCSSFKKCKECNKQKNCEWRTRGKSCIIAISHSNKKPPCACENCLSWYTEEVKDIRWLEKVNKQFRCPCNARLINNSEMKEIENPSDVKWVPDTLCQNPSSEGCLKYHSGAAGCLRSNRPTDDNAGQQCCYGSDGKLISPGSIGAGTPDKKYGNPNNMYDHYIVDVVPYGYCCTNCEIGSYCDYYINKVRKGDDSHCPK